MSGADLVLHPEEYERIREIIGRLRTECNAKIVFLVDKNGQQLAATGELEKIDTTALASLAAGNVAATDSLARLLGEKEFSILFHEGEKDNLHISVVAGKVILVVIFDERSSLGLVRLRVRRGSTDLKSVLDVVWTKSAAAPKKKAANGPFAEITDEDIDRLFSD
ncbi:MAG TPA: roadblock/LC7 domain-containing protein [Candidatus Polarisedimenticolia bacterium]|nr:roadblock/LC7 domain-containing protein [Candidatus Polarisedimenticolia bacterium]